VTSKPKQSEQAEPDVCEAKPYARNLFKQLAQRFIAPAAERGEGVRVYFDAETDGLLDAVTKGHCIVGTDLGGDRVDEYGPDQIPAALEHLARVDYLTGHNIQGFDLPVLRKLYGWTPPPGCRIVDTLIAARLILPNLAELDAEVIARTNDAAFRKVRGSYSIEAFGVRFGMRKVGAEITNWSQWTPELQARCVGDVAIGKALWQFLQPDGYSRDALELEHRAAAICERISADGLPFDRAAAERLYQRWSARRVELEVPLRKQFPGVKITSRLQIGNLLEARGWVPEERSKKTGKPSVKDEVLESIAEIYPEFTGLAEHFLIGRRLAQIAGGKEAWLKHVDADGRIHGGLVHIGTPHSRAAHRKPNLAGVPNPKKGKPFATECRALFRADDDWVFVACDQSTLQDRGFAHYLAAFDGGAYAQSILLASVDQHWQCATALELVPFGTARDKEDRVHTAIREGAKRFRYAFLFGAQALTAGRIVADTVRTVGSLDAEAGNALCEQFWGGNSHPGEKALRQAGERALERFMDATPGLRELRANLGAQHQRCGWIEGLDGRRVPTGLGYKALNRIVTASEAVICKRWLIDAYDELCARFRYGCDGEVYLALWIHDEVVAICRPEIAEQVGEILIRRARAAGDRYGFRVPLDAKFEIGRAWANDSQQETEPPSASAAAPIDAGPIRLWAGFRERLRMVANAIVVPPAPEITVCANARGPLTKRITLEADGSLAKPDAKLLSGSARRVRVESMASLAALITSLKQNEALALGALCEDLPAAVKVTTAEKRNGPGPIARTTEFLQFRPGMPALVLLDLDRKMMPAEIAARIEKLGGFWEALTTILPDLKGAGYLRRGSTSSGLYRTDTGERFSSGGGEHAYVRVCDGADIPRFLKDLHTRAWLHGFGWIALGAAGQLLERSLIDVSVGAPDRLVFEAAPILAPPLAQNRPPPIVREGEMIDTRTLCPPLSAQELTTINARRGIARDRIADEAAKVQAAYNAKRAAELIASGMTPEAAREELAKREEGALRPRDVLIFGGRLGTVTVADVIADPERFAGMSLADPIEGPSYGRATAKVFLGEDGWPWIKSFAHGGCRYRLRCDAALLRELVEAADDPAAMLAKAAPHTELSDAEREEVGPWMAALLNREPVGNADAGGNGHDPGAQGNGQGAGAGGNGQGAGASTATTANSRPIEPVDLWAKFDPPELPRGLLPPDIETFAREQGRIMGTDPAGLAMAALTACAAALPDRIKLRPKKHDTGWRESARIWTALVGPPSTKKTPICRKAMRPIERIDRELYQAYAAQKRDLKAAPKADRESMEEPLQKRLRLEDATVEAAQGVFRDSPDGLLVFRDELSGWFGSMDKYAGHRGAAMDRGFWLQAWNGGGYAFDRVGRGSHVLENVSASILGGIQPEPLRELAEGTIDDGLLQRLFVILLRPATIGTDEPVSAAVAQYETLIARLYEARFAFVDFELDDGARKLRAKLEAKHLAYATCESVNRKLGAHIGKYDGLFVRLCLLWHCIEHDDPPPYVSEATATRVARFLHEFLLPHAFAFYVGMLGLADHDRLADLAGYILAHRLESVTSRDVQRSVRSLRKLDRADTESLFHQLAALGWVVQGFSYRPSDPARWAVNPEVHRLFAARAAEEKERRERTRQTILEMVGGVRQGGAEATEE
jgi:DNA polymerase I-like protein with 3'-5' exonuclease and polymerase domains